MTWLTSLQLTAGQLHTRWAPLLAHPLLPPLTERALGSGSVLPAPCLLPAGWLQVFLTHTPGVNSFFSMEPMAGLQWLRVFVCMAIVYFIER